MHIDDKDKWRLINKLTGKIHQPCQYCDIEGLKPNFVDCYDGAGCTPWKLWKESLPVKAVGYNLYW